MLNLETPNTRQYIQNNILSISTQGGVDHMEKASEAVFLTYYLSQKLIHKKERVGTLFLVLDRLWILESLMIDCN